MSEERQALVRRRLALYEDETRKLLVRACEWADHLDEETRQLYQRNVGDNTIPVLPTKKPAVVVSEMDSDGNDNSESSTTGEEDESERNSDSDSDELDDNENADDSNPGSTLPTLTEAKAVETTEIPKAKSAKIPKNSGKNEKRLAQEINRHSNNLIRIDLPLPPANIEQDEAKVESNDIHLHLFPAAALLPKVALRDPVKVSNQAHAVKSLSEQLSSDNDAVVVVLLIQSGRFAGGVFRRGKCLAHRDSPLYHPKGTRESPINPRRQPASEIGRFSAETCRRRTTQARYQNDVGEMDRIRVYKESMPDIFGVPQDHALDRICTT